MLFLLNISYTETTEDRRNYSSPRAATVLWQGTIV
jgi:hypothetical protein